ncbi:MAG: hypothetical protein ACI9XO_001151 [Paraglaciecola sp.]|jgi:hypothetical protein
MQDNKKYILLGIAILLMTVFFAYFFGNPKKQVNWREDYKEINKGPFGTFLSLKLLEEYFPNNGVTILKDSIAQTLEKEENPANYVFVGGNMYMDSLGESALLKFVERGNKALIASKSPPSDLMQLVFEDYCGTFYWDYYPVVQDSSAYFNLKHPDLSLGDSLLHVAFEEEFDTTTYHWHHFPEDFFCEENEHLVALGSFDSWAINFIKVNYGKGSFYFHTNPILYTNSVLKQEDGFEYAHRSFAHLQEGETYWDQRSRIWYSENSQDDWFRGKKTFESEGPLKYILAQPSLAWAWYLSLALGLLYLLFRAKRQQRVIPVTEPNRNTSLEFISTIGRMYFVQNDHRKLAKDKARLFLAYVRDNYKIQTKKIDNSFIQTLANKAEISPDLIKKIVEIKQKINLPGGLFTEEMLIDFHQALDQFYKNCK